MDIDKDKLNLAVRRYIGYGVTSFPKEDPARLIADFGPELSSQLEVKVKTLLDELDAIKPDGDGSPLVNAQRAVAQLKENHPELDSTTIAALEWIYSWW
jgi:hypothetical protein